MILTKYSIKKPVMVSMLILVAVIMGYLAWRDMPVDVMPNISLPFVTVQSIYPGASPEVIETNITRRIEDEVSTISGLRSVRSIIMENVSFTILEFEFGKDGNIAVQEVKDKLDAIVVHMPDDAQQPVVTQMDIHAQPIMQLSFTSNMDESQAFEYVNNYVSDRLSAVSGVARVDVSGARNREIQILFDRNTLRKYNITPLLAVGMIQSNNLSLPAGNIRMDGLEYSINIFGEFVSLDDLKNLEIPTPIGPKKLSDIAEIRDTHQDRTGIAFYKRILDEALNRTESQLSQSINISIMKQSAANTMSVAEGLIKELEQINTDLGERGNIDIVRDDSQFIDEAVSDTTNNIIMGIILTGIIMFLFLHTLKTTFIIAITMPVVLIATFFLMDIWNFSINMLTLMALSVSIGTIVTNAVVILENITHHIKMGHSVEKASEHGASEIANAVIASTLTNVAVFMPIATMRGIAGQFFMPFGLTVTFTMVFSIITSFTLTPMMTAKLLKSKTDKPKKLTGFTHLFETTFVKLTSDYEAVLSKIVYSTKAKILLPLLTVLALVITAVFVGPRLGFEFMPTTDEGTIGIEMELPNYYTLERTKNIVLDAIERVEVIEEVEVISSVVGATAFSTAQNQGVINIQLVPSAARRRTTNDVIVQINQMLSNIPDAKITVASISSMGGDMGGAPIQIDITGVDGDKVATYTQKVYEITKNAHGTVSVDTDIREGKPELKIVPDREKLSFYRLSAADFAMTIRTMVEGVEAGVFREGGQEYSIKIRMDREDVSDPEKIKNALILTERGFVKISNIANVYYSQSPAQIQKKDKMRTHSVSAHNIGRTSGEITNDIFAEIAKLDVPSDVRIAAAGMAQMQEETFTEMFNALFIALLLTFMLIAGLLESFKQALLIMFSFVFALIGILWALFITNTSLNIISLMAIIMLLGVVVNNAILILDHANALRQRGIDKFKAIISSGPLKLRAVVMSSAAIILSMLPLAIGLGEGADFRRSMGIVSIGGMLTSTFLVLFVIPTLYVVFVKDKKRESEVDEQ